jgi:transcriptional regulator with GAF, ATPase, and Fis domain
LDSAWIKCFGRADCAETVGSALAKAGIEACSLNGEFAQGPGVLVFASVGQELFEQVHTLSRCGEERVLVLAADPSLLRNDDHWRLLDAGASDVLSWEEACEPVMQQMAARLKRWIEVEELLNSSLVRKNLVGDSPAWKAVLRLAIEVARFSDASVLILGESGTGKELLARLIHTLDPRAMKKDIVVLDCTTVIPELSGSEFFGHERGAFTGAVSARDGAFALADGGTLFLDEVGELLPALQAQLLRVIHEKSYKRLGGTYWRNTSFRLICATNRDLAQEVKQGSFRGDLYYRIASWVFRLPPLRDRPDDIMRLVHHFLAELQPEQTPPPVQETIREFFVKRAYPGNVRELRQLVARIHHRHVGPGPITLGDIPEDERPGQRLEQQEWRDAQLERCVRRALARGLCLKAISQAATETAIRIAVGDERGNLQRAARKLGVTDRALQLRRANSRQLTGNENATATGEQPDAARPAEEA